MNFPPIWGTEKASRKGLKNGLIGHLSVESSSTKLPVICLNLRLAKSLLFV